jgi:hypothetical protein
MFSKKVVYSVIILFALLALGSTLFYLYQSKQPPELVVAESTGPAAIYQLLVKIDNNSSQTGFQRGDVIMIAPVDKKWSQAEIEGFLIIQTKINIAQASLLLAGQDNAGQVALRRYYVNLPKLGIGPTETKGRLLGDQVWDWQTIVEQKSESNNKY